MNDQELQDLREENELLLMQLHQVQEELEKYYLRNQELERRSRYAGSGSYANNAGVDKHEHLKTLIKRVRQIENSRSWWLTKPFKAFTRLILRKKKAQKPLADWAGVDKKIQFQEKRLKQLEQSTYWRIMRPYRVVGDLFRHGPSILFGGRTKRELAEAQIERLGVVLTAQHEELTQADRRQERFRQAVRAEAQALEADKAQLTEAKDKALAQVQQLEQEKAQALQRCDELVKAKEAEVKAKAELQIQLDQTRQYKEADAKELKRLQANLTKSIKTEVTNATKQLEAFFGIKSYFESGEVLGELHGWPISPDLGLYLIQQLEATPYDLVIEFGSGTSTQLMAKALAAMGQRHPTSPKPVQVAFEHLAKYHQKTLSVLQQSGHAQSVYLHHTPLAPYHAPDGTVYDYYDCEAQLQALINFIENKAGLRIFALVDGPPKSTGVHARYPALLFLLKHFKHAHIDMVLDDYNRPEEKEVAQKWVADLQALQIEHSLTEEELDKGACKLSITAPNKHA